MKNRLLFPLFLGLMLLCPAISRGVEVIPAGTYSGTWTQHSIEQLDGMTRTATSVVVSAENDGKQTITFKGYKVGYTGDVATDIKIEVTTSNGACSIATDTKTGHTNAKYGDMYIRTYGNYTSAINPQSMIISLCARYYYIRDSEEVTLQGYKNNYEYIQLNSSEWTNWIDFPATGKNTAVWTFNTNNAFYSLIDPSCQVTLQSRENVADTLLKQILVKGYKMNSTSSSCIATDLVLNWDTETNEITMAYSGLGFYESTAKQARGKMTSTGKFDFETGKFTLPMEYVYANTWKGAVQETLQLQDFESMYSDWTDFKPLGLAKGNYHNDYKNADHNDLPITERHSDFAENLKQIKVQDWNYSDNVKGKKDLIIDWNSETNVCTIAQQKTNYTTNQKDIYVSTRSNGTYNPETATFSLPIKYATTETVLSSDKTDVLQMQKAVTSITFEEEEYTLASGFVRTITPTVAPEDATNKSVTYTSFDPSVATVDNGEDESHPAGKIHFQSVGTTTITATAKDGSGVSGSYKLTTFVRVTGITLDKTSVDLCPNSDVTLTATIAPNNATAQTVKWSSSDENVVTVDESGKLQFVGIGEATITAAADDDSGISATCTVSTYRLSIVHPEYGNEFIVPVKGGKAYFKDAPSSSQLQILLEGKAYNKDDWEISGTNLSWLTRGRGYDGTSQKVLFSFSAADSTLTLREGSLFIKAYDYEFDYTISQAAPTLTPDPGMDNEQSFTFLAAGDDTLLVNDEKKQYVYLGCEVELKDDKIDVISKQGLTRIDTSYVASDTIRLTLTRKQLLPEEAKDTIVVYFKDNPDIKYEYYITQTGAGRLSTNHDYRTFVVGPKGGNALAVDENDEITYANSVRVYANIPTTDNVKSGWYSTTHICDFSAINKQDDGYYKLILPIKIEGENTTGADRLDSFCVYLPNCDTIKFYVRQEPQARVWQKSASVLTQLEVNNKGGLAHFKGYTNTEMTLVSNTMGFIDEDGVEITFTDGAGKWVTPTKTVNSTGDSVFITFDVNPLTGTESRSTDITITIQGKEFTIPLTQKTFGIEWSYNGNNDTLVIPVAGGTAKWKGSDYSNLFVFGTEAYRDALLKVTAPEGVTINRDAPEILSTGRQRTTFTFSKKDTLTADWSDSIFISFDSINDAEPFEYHFKDTIIITQAAAKMWYDANQSEGLSFAAEDEKSEDIKVWSNFPFSTKSITFYTTYSTDNKWFTIQPNQNNAIKDGDNYYYLFYIKTEANTEEERSGSVYVALKNKTEIKTETLSFTQLAPTYTRTVTNGNWGTICLPWTSTALEGGEFYNVLGTKDPTLGVALELIDQLEAGKPYVFFATSDQIKVTYDPETEVEDSVYADNHIYGSFSGCPVPAEMYVLISNLLYKTAEATTAIGTNRAYFDADNMEAYNPKTAPARVAFMGGRQAPTGLGDSRQTTGYKKVIKDGQFVIIKDNKMYNAQGIEIQ